ncbi:MAG: protein tyrosine phosphatase, partial [Myxococcaceae bacterium]
MILSLTVSLWLAAAPTPPPEVPKAGVYSLSDDAFVEQAKRDLAALHRYANGLRRVQEQLDQQQGLFHQKGTQAYSPEQKQILLSAWASLYDYTMSTELIRQRYWDFVKLPPTNDANSKKHALGFLLTHGALTTELAHGLKFSDRTAGDKQLETLLDEPSPEYGIPPRAFEQFKAKVLHVSTTTQLLTGDSYASSLVPTYRKTKLIELDDVKWVIGEMKLNSQSAKDRLMKRGVTLFAKNAADIAMDTTMQGIFPVQKNVAEWMG